MRAPSGPAVSVTSSPSVSTPASCVLSRRVVRRRADLDAALERIHERVVARRDAMREARARRKLDVEIERIGREAAHGPRDLAPVERERACDHFHAAAARQIDGGNFLGLDVAVARRASSSPSPAG